MRKSNATIKNDTAHALVEDQGMGGRRMALPVQAGELLVLAMDGTWVKILHPTMYVLGLMLSYHVFNTILQKVDPTAGTLDLGVLSMAAYAVLVALIGAKLVTLIFDVWSTKEKGGVSWHYLTYETGMKVLMWLGYLLWSACLF